MKSVRVPLSRPQLGKAEADAAARVVRARSITQGPEVAAFEAELAAAVGAPFAIAVASGTAALELGLRALRIGPGDEVLTVSHGFIATVNAVMAVGARPVFLDVEADTFGMDPALIEGAIGPRCKAILCAHQLGIPCDLGRILEVAAARGLPVIEDAACALGSEIEIDSPGDGAPGLLWERIGRPHGVMACFSFHARTLITTGDGGMITTADATLAARLRSLRQHAAAEPSEDGEADPLATACYHEPAYNVRLTDLAAAIGRPQLARLDGFLTERRRLASVFTQALVDHPILQAPVERSNARSNWQSFPARLRPGGGMTQDQVLRFFHERGITCRRGLTNAHKEPAYEGRDVWRGGPFPVSEGLRDSIIIVPLFNGMSRDEERAVVRALEDLRGAGPR